MLKELQNSAKVVGTKQLLKSLKDGAVAKVFLARNADPNLVEPLHTQCLEMDVPCIWVQTMDELGKACAIDVGTAVAAILRQPN